MQSKKIASFFLCLTMLLCLCACNKNTGTAADTDKKFCCSWFEQGDEEAAFTLFSDGTCDIANTYGTGTWAIVNNDQLKITDYYGSSDVYTVQSISDTKLVLIDDHYTRVFWNSASLSMDNAAAAAEAMANAPEVLVERFSSPADYSEGFAWVTRSYGDDYYACLDKTGKIVFQFSAQNVEDVTAFSRGYTHVVHSNYAAVIDTEGNVLSSYELNEKNVLMAYGDGYTVIESYSGGFDSSEYVYRIYDPHGNVIEELSNDGEQYASADHCGNGAFSFKISGNEYFYYFAPTKQSGHSEYKCRFYDELVVEEIYEVFDEFDNYLGTYIRFFNTNGEHYENAIEPSDVLSGTFEPIIDRLGEFSFDNTIGTAIAEDGICILNYFSCNSIFYDDRNFILSYDIENNALYGLDETYSNKLIPDLMPEEVIFDSRRIALPLQGNDGEAYIAVFDEQLNIILEPTRMDSYRPYTDGRMFVTLDGETYVYDENGNIVFTYSDVGYSEISDYSDGAALVTEEYAGIVYLDKNGNILFDTIDSADMIDISEQLPWWENSEE